MRTALLFWFGLLGATSSYGIDDPHVRELHREISRLAEEVRKAGELPAHQVTQTALKTAILSLPAETQAGLAKKLAAVTMMLEDGNRWPTLRRQPSSTAVAAYQVGASEHATCEAAAHETRRVGANLPPEAELWVRVTTPPRPGWLLVDTGASDFDTTIEIWSDCPSRGGRLLARGDDELGLQAQATVQLVESQLVYVRLAGWSGQGGSLAATIEGTEAGITGRIVREGTLDPLSELLVVLWAPSGLLLQVATTNASGNYAFAVQPPGSYYLTTRTFFNSSGLLDELYDDIPCPGGPPGGCTLSQGTAVVVQQGEITSGIDFELGGGGRLAGRIVDEETSQPLLGLAVSAFNANGNTVATGVSAEAGRYVLSGLVGEIFVTATGSSLHQSEVYEDLHCGGACQPTTGTPVATTIGSTVQGIDFDLERRGTIAGRVTESATGAPLASARVAVYQASGALVQTLYTNSQGKYVLGGLAGGNYFAVARATGYVDELWNNRHCAPACDALEGDPIEVVLDQITDGVDFGLEGGGKISGSVHDAQSGLPVLGGSVYVFTAEGSFLSGASTENGSYTVSGLQPGTHRVYASGYQHRGVLYDGVDCPNGPPAGCSLALGTEVLVAAESVTAGVNFELQPLAAFNGSVVPVGSTNPISSYQVRVWDEAHNFVRSGWFSTPSWELLAIQPGEYYVSVSHVDYLGELFDDLPCPAGDVPACDPTFLAPTVTATSGSTTGGINFELELLGSIAGTVTRADTGELFYGHVEVFDGAGQVLRSVWAQGEYSVGGLETGTYTVKASGSNSTPILFDNVPCPPGCDPTTGTPVAVVRGSTTSGIDLVVPALGSISGSVDVTAGTPPPWLLLVAYTPSGAVYSATSIAGGEYQVTLPAGTYFFAATDEGDYQLQLYPGINCPTGTPCPVTTATPVTVFPGANTPAINFDLEPESGILGRVLDSRGEPLAGVAIDLWLTTGTWSHTTLTGANGRYRFSASQPGTYYVSTDNGQGAIDQVWPDVLCPLGPAYLGLCDPLEGDTVTLPYGGLVGGIDFVLTRVPLFADGFEVGDTSAWGP